MTVQTRIPRDQSTAYRYLPFSTSTQPPSSPRHLLPAKSCDCLPRAAGQGRSQYLRSSLCRREISVSGAQSTAPPRLPSRGRQARDRRVCVFHGFRPVSSRDSGHPVHAISATLGTKRRRTLHCYSDNPVVVKLSFVLRMDSPLRLSR